MFQKNGVPAPFNTTIELTRRCNQKCIHCFNDLSSRTELALPEWKKVLDVLWDLGCLELTLTGGEPLVYRDFRGIVQYAARRGFAVTVFTNGTLLADDMLDFLKDRIFKLEATIFADKPEIHDAITQVKGSLRNLWGNLEAARRKGVRIIAKIPMLKANCMRRESLKKALRSIGIPSREYFSIVPTLSRKDKPESLAVTDREVPKQWIGTLSEKKLRVCNAGRTNLYISSEGDMYPCIFIRRKVGNVARDDLRNVWASEKYLSYLRSLKYEQFEECSRCEKRAICRNCMGINLSMTGSLFKPYRGFCHLFKSA